MKEKKQLDKFRDRQKRVGMSCVKSRTLTSSVCEVCGEMMMKSSLTPFTLSTIKENIKIRAK